MGNKAVLGNNKMAKLKLPPTQQHGPTPPLGAPTHAPPP